MNCVTKKLEKCILISRLHDIKCTHNGGDIFLKDKLSLLRISIHFIFVTTLLLKLIEGVNRLWKEKVIMSSKFWEEFSYTFASFLQLLIWTAILTVEKEIFKLVFGGTDLTMFAEKCRIKILKEYDIKVINKFQKGALFFIILNPIYVSTWIDYVFCNRKSILNQICEIWAVYMISCLGFYAEIGYLIHKLIWYNLFKILKISLLKYKGTVAFDNKIKIIKTMVSKLRHHFNIMENILTPPSIVIVSLIPVIVMNIFTKFFLEMQSEELTINLCGINLLLACGYATVLYFNLLISMENCQKPVSFPHLIVNSKC